MRTEFQTLEERKALFGLIDVIKENSRTLADMSRPMFNGVRYITDTELAKRLGIEKRTLANYRAKGYIGFYSIGGKILYAENEIEDLLNENYIPPLK